MNTLEELQQQSPDTNISRDAGSLQGEANRQEDANSGDWTRIVQRTLRHGRVKVHSIYYSSDALRTLSTRMTRGQRVPVKVNRENLDAIQVLDPFTQQYITVQSLWPEYTRKLTWDIHEDNLWLLRQKWPVATLKRICREAPEPVKRPSLIITQKAESPRKQAAPGPVRRARVKSSPRVGTGTNK
ncbi:MAG: Mu transposase C-terminal domain-containing protein [Thiobacillaceae bacterium]